MLTINIPIWLLIILGFISYLGIGIIIAKIYLLTTKKTEDNYNDAISLIFVWPLIVAAIPLLFISVVIVVILLLPLLAIGFIIFWLIKGLRYLL